MGDPMKTDESKNPAPPKKPYVKPEFRHEQVFETRALQCGKTSTQGNCGRAVRTS